MQCTGSFSSVRFKGGTQEEGGILIVREITAKRVWGCTRSSGQPVGRFWPPLAPFLLPPNRHRFLLFSNPVSKLWRPTKDVKGIGLVSSLLPPFRARSQWAMGWNCRMCIWTEKLRNNLIIFANFFYLIYACIFEKRFIIIFDLYLPILFLVPIPRRVLTSFESQNKYHNSAYNRDTLILKLIQSFIII